MRLPRIALQDHDGGVAQLPNDLPTGLSTFVFLRHSACLFCREQVSMLNAFPIGALNFVTMGEVPDTRQFRLTMRSPHRFFADPDRTFYRYLGLERGSLKQLFGPQVVKRGFGTIRSGTFGGFVPTSDPVQLGGLFIVRQDGEVVWARKARDASDNVSSQELTVVLAKLEASASRDDE
jgi:hypothetical protein